MQKDTRDRNKYFKGSSVAAYTRNYSKALSKAIDSVPEDQLQNAGENLYRATRVFVGGNGGSAAIADHLVCDHTKGIDKVNARCAHVHSLNGQTALFTAIANDIGYEHTLSRQLALYAAKPGDTLILISSSGNSPNIVRAAEFAKKNSLVLIGLTGFDGGKLKKLADIKLHVNFNNYGIVEDAHQAIMHILAQYIYLND